MRQLLIVHPDSAGGAVTGIEVAVARSGGLLMLDYVVTGAIGQLALPAAAPPVRGDKLWEHSCFEAFIGEQKNYLEINLTAGGAWAAYRFHGYRQGKRNAGMHPPRIETERSAGRFALRAEVRINWWAGPLGLCAVIEEKSGRRSYWALAHPPGDPDFHHPDCFALELPPAGRI